MEGLAESVGGGARPEEDAEGPPRLGAGPRARCAELGAGNWLREGMRPLGRDEGRGGGGIMLFKVGGGIILLEVGSTRERLGTGRAGVAA